MRLFGRGRRAPVTAAEAPSARAPAPVFDILNPAFVADPYPTFAALREREPVHRSPTGAWVLTRHRDVQRAFADERLGNAPSPYAVVHARNRERYACADVANNILPFLDAPEHVAPRRIVGRAFHDQLRRNPLDMEALAAGLLDRLAGRAELDVLADFATPFSVAVMLELLGLPSADEARLESWSEWFFYLFMAIPSEEVREGLDRALSEFRAWFAEQVADRRQSPRDDLISTMLAASLEGESLGDAELVDTCMLLFADGVENVDRGIANALHTLLEHPNQLELLRGDPALLPAAVDECLRYESPAQFVGRIAREDLELEGVTIKRGAPVLLVIGSANRDPEAFPEPDRFDVTRSPNRHLAFGQGRHSCIGAPLVRAEMQAALSVLLERCPELHLTGGALTWTPRPGHRWLAALPVRRGRA